ncbi:hypothetical protein K2X33_12785 [bacterium]|nr:hypothetical protein [bacterium]
MGKIAWEPSFALLLPWQTDNEGGTRTFTGQFASDLGASLFSWLRFRAGVSLQGIFALSSPQSIDLNNGTGTSTFYSPGGTSIGLICLVEAGLEFILSPKLSVGLEVWSSEVLSSSRRRFQGAAYLGLKI